MFFLNVHGLVECLLLIDEPRIVLDHGGDGLLAHLLAKELALREPVLLQELQICTSAPPAASRTRRPMAPPAPVV